MNVSFNGTENIIQNYCITFTHQFDYKYSRITNSFVIKGVDVSKEDALAVTKILFRPPKFTNIEIISVENDENTLTPGEYDFIRGQLMEKRQSTMRTQEHRIQDGKQKGPLVEDEYTLYLLKLINKMKARMNQFPVYHT
jgi:hypothetical protein